MIVCELRTIVTVIWPGESGVSSFVIPAPTVVVFDELPQRMVTVAWPVEKTTAHMASWNDSER